MVESIWTTGSVTVGPAEAVGPALARGLDAARWASPAGAPGLCVVVLSPGLDGRAARAALQARLPDTPVLVLQAEGLRVGAERVGQGAALLLGHWPGPPALLRRLPSARAIPAATGPAWLFAETCSPALEHAVERAKGRIWGATAEGLLEPMGSPAALFVELPAALSMELRLAVGAAPVGRPMRAGRVRDGQIGTLDGIPASRALAALGAALPAADRERLRLRPLLLRAGGPSWAIGGLGRPLRVLGVHEGSGELLVQGRVDEGSLVALGAARPAELGAALRVAPLPAQGLRLGLLVSRPARLTAVDPEPAAALWALGACPMLGFTAERQLFAREGRTAALAGSSVLAAIFEPPWS